MPGVLQQPNLLNLPDWVKTANIQDGAVTLAKLADLANATEHGGHGSTRSRHDGSASDTTAGGWHGIKELC